MPITHKTRFEGQFISENGRINILRIYDKNYTGAIVPITIGGGGVKIKYDTKGQEKFSPIMASKCAISLVIDTTITGQWLEQFITSLREDYEEGDVTVVIWNNSNTSNEPLWSGNVLIDLSSKEDASKPYEVELNATDGIGLLKNYDMVATQGSSPYIGDDTYISDGYQTFIYWIAKILEYCNTPDSDSTDGDVSDYKFSTSVDWWYEDHPSIYGYYSPLQFTLCQMQAIYELTQNGLYKVKDVYEVLESFCKMWGMRVVFWRNRFYFTQLELYNIADSGTFAVPDNVDSQLFTKAGVASGSQSYLGDTWFSLYSQDIETNAGGFAGGLQKLAGSTWDYYPKLKEVEAEFQSISNVNYFQRFPQFSAGGSSYNTLDNLTSQPIGTIQGASGFGGFNIVIVLDYTSGLSPFMSCCTNWGVRAKPSADSDFANGYYLTTYTTSATGYEWKSYPGIATDAFRAEIVGSGLSSAAQASAFRSYLINDYNNIQIGSSQKTIFSGIVPTDSNFTGSWDFEFFTLGFWYNVSQPQWIGHHSNSYTPGWFGSWQGAAGAISYSDVYNIGIPVSQFNPVLNSVIGGDIINTAVYSARSETQKQEVKNIWWGDTPTPGEPSSLRWWNGSATYGYSDPTGKWRNGQTGSFDKSITELLCEARLFNQQQSDYKWSLVTAVSETNKNINDGTATRPVYINPLGRIHDTIDDIFYYLLRGTFNMLKDQWEGEWLQISLNNSISTTTTTTGTGGSVPSDDFASARLAAPSTPERVRAFILTDTTANVEAGEISSIPINMLVSNDSPSPSHVIKEGDKFYLSDVQGSFMEEFEASADVDDDATSISVVTNAIPIAFKKGAYIIMNNADLYKQYQHKDRGTIAGFTVDADGIAKGGVEITGWLDSDGMVGATKNNLATAESIKAYVDAQSHVSDPEYLMATCSSTATTSATQGEAYAVVIPFNQAIQQSAGEVIHLSEGEGATNTIGITTTGIYEFHWNVASTIGVVANRFNAGVKLQGGLTDGEGGYSYSDLDPSHCYIYNRAYTTQAMLGSTSASIIIAHSTTENNYIYRLVIWKDTAASVSTTGITEIDGTQITITKIE